MKFTLSWLKDHLDTNASLAEIVESERTFTSDRPFVLLGQPSLFDPTRAPVGKHTAWA